MDQDVRSRLRLDATTPIDDAIFDRVLRELEQPTSGFGHAYATPGYKQQSNRLSESEFSDELTLLSYENVEAGVEASVEVQELICRMTKE